MLKARYLSWIESNQGKAPYSRRRYPKHVAAIMADIGRDNKVVKRLPVPLDASDVEIMLALDQANRDFENSIRAHMEPNKREVLVALRKGDNIAMLHRVLLMTIVLCSDAYASAEHSIPPLRRWVSETLAEAQTAFEAKNFVDANTPSLDALGDADGQFRAKKILGILKNYELANVYNLCGYASYAQGDNEKTPLNYEGVIAQPDIPKPCS